VIGSCKGVEGECESRLVTDTIDGLPEWLNSGAGMFIGILDAYAQRRQNDLLLLLKYKKTLPLSSTKILQLLD
jgi:hypothetical protein